MNILHVADGFTRGGFERFLIDCSQGFAELGHENHYAFGNESPSQDALPARSFTRGFHFLDGSAMTVGGFLSDVASLRKLMERESIDVVICHPFRCLAATAIAAQLEHVAVGYVVHGALSITFPESLAENALFRTCLCHSIDALFTVNPATVSRIGNTAASVIHIRQPIDTSIPPRTTAPDNNRRWALASRLDSDKAKGISQLIDMLPKLDIDMLYVYGDGDSSEQLEDQVERNGLGGKVEFKGYRSDWLNEAVDTAFGIIGSERVALEALAAGMPVILSTPYDNPCGILSPDLYERAITENLTGFSLDKIGSAAHLNAQVQSAYAEPRKYDLSRRVREANSAKAIATTMIENLETPHGLCMPRWDSFLDTLSQADESDMLFTCREMSNALIWYPASFFPDTNLRDEALLGRELINLREFTEGLAARDESLQQELSASAKRIAKLEKKVEKLDKQLVRTRKSVELLKNSSSWKIGRAATAVPRWVKSSIKK